MSAPRLLILADPKMLPALAGGLREGGRFDVTAVSLADPGAAQAAVDRADALAVFYGAPGAPLSAALQALGPKVRERGGRVVAVLQREQAPQRDECFRAGASDLLFMPMPRDQFIARLAGSVALAFAQDGGAPAPVAVATRGSASRLDRATVSPAGVESQSQLPLKAGETVRLSWAGFQSWGLVVRGAPSAQIRFAGLAPDEEVKIREWVKGAAQNPAAPVPQPQRAPAQPVPAQPVVPQPAPPQPVVPQPAPPQPAPPQPVIPSPQPMGRAAPGAGPPPGFADRQSPRAPPRPPPRPAGAPIMTPAGGSAPVPRSPAASAPQAAAARPRSQNGAGGLEGLFDGDGAAAPVPPPAPARPAAPPAPARPAAPPGPPWPAPVSADTCRKAAVQLLTDDTVGAGVPANIAASARKVTGMLSVGERAWIEQTGADSHFADALAARIALDASTAEANRLASAGSTPVVDAESLGALTKVADEASARLQKEANAAIGKGELESLQLVTAASAALSRDFLNLKEAADRLRGIGAARRLGGGHLDPDMILPGQQPRPRPPPGPQAPAPVKAELRDFRGLDHKPSRAKEIIAVIILAAAIGAAAHGFYFSVPHQHDVPVQSAGDGVQHITVNGTSAVVTVSPDWVAGRESRLPRLLQVLRTNQVKKAVLMLPDGSSVGMVDVAAGKAIGIAAPAR